MLTTSTLSLTLAQPAVVQLLGDCDALHRFVMAAFPSGASGPSGPGGRLAHSVLYRVERRHDRAQLTVRAQSTPDWAFVRRAWLLHPVVATVAFDPHAFPQGARVGLKVFVNPTRSEKPARDGDGGVRVRTRGTRRAVTDVLGVTQRCLTHLAEAGLAVVPDDLTLSALRWVVGARTQREVPRSARRPDLTFSGVDVSAVAVVEDTTRLAHALETGIGRGKAYGFGLLDIVALDG